MKDAKPPRHIIPFAEALKFKSLRHLAGAAHQVSPRKAVSSFAYRLPFGGSVK